MCVPVHIQVKSEKWNGMFVDLLPGNEVETGSIIKAQIELPPPSPEPMVSLLHFFYFVHVTG